MGDMYDLINTAKSRFSSSKVILSGVLRRDVSWRRIGAVNDRLGWVANTLGGRLWIPIAEWTIGATVEMACI